MAGPVLSIEGLKIEFARPQGALVAVNDVSFDVRPGEILGLVGESGAGKSIIGSAIMGLLDPPGRIGGGAISLKGERIDGLPEPLFRRIRGKRIGMIFQDPMTSLNPLFTVGEQLIRTMTTHLDISRSAARERALALMHDVGIVAPEKRIDQYPHQFSGGMRQRIVVTLALCAEPEI
ncbi:MAG: ATP-binding cassette domain-containing protein, partial [Dongiaceae bacterium]